MIHMNDHAFIPNPKVPPSQPTFSKYRGWTIMETPDKSRRAVTLELTMNGINYAVALDEATFAHVCKGATKVCEALGQMQKERTT